MRTCRCKNHVTTHGGIHTVLCPRIHAKRRKRDSCGVYDAQSRECGIQRQVQVKNWVYDHAACLTKSDWKMDMRPGSMHGAGGGVEVGVLENSQHGDKLARMKCVRRQG